MLSNQLVSIVVVAFVLCMGLGYAQSHGLSQTAVIGLAVAVGLVLIVGMKQKRNQQYRMNGRYDAYQKADKRRMQAKSSPTRKNRTGIVPHQGMESMHMEQPGGVGGRVGRYHGEVETRNQAIQLKRLAFND